MEIFEFEDYRSYLRQALSEKHGIQSRLARALDCQASHISKVLNGAAQLSLEQADLVNEFLGHNTEQSDFFILLVEYDRSGTENLRKHFLRHIGRLREAHINMKKRFDVKDHLTGEDQVIFYSHWYFAASLAVLTLPGLHTSETVSDRLRIPKKVAAEVLDFFLRTGMAKKVGSRVIHTLTRTHLGKDSPLIARHHVNWRVQAIQSIESGRENDLHYSTIATLSRSDIFRIKADLVKAIEQANKTISASKEESLCGFCVDFFEV